MRYFGFFCLLLLAACAAPKTGPFVSHVDERTGQSVVYAENPLRFSASRLGLSHVGKDYLVVSPLRANISGTNRDYLFFAIGSSIDRALADAPVPDVQTIILRADKQLMSFETTAWSELSRQAPFKMNLIVHDMLVASLTQSEMRFIAEAESLSAWLLSGDQRSPEYELQTGEHDSWADF